MAHSPVSSVFLDYRNLSDLTGRPVGSLSSQRNREGDKDFMGGRLPVQRPDGPNSHPRFLWCDVESYLGAKLKYNWETKEWEVSRHS